MNLRTCLKVFCLFISSLIYWYSLPSALAQVDYLSFKTEDEANNIEIFNQASPSVVYVTNTTLRRANPFSRNAQEIPQGSGTGFIWDKSGLIVTNAHVIQGARRVLITLQDQSVWDAKVLGKAEGKDLALLRIDAPAEKLTPLPLGSSKALEVGRKVIAIGNPFGLDTTLTIGVVSALGREINALDDRTIRDVIQTDASINPGNSGGPLLNSLGQLIGVNTQIVSPSGASAGIGFAIPVDTVKRIIPQLLEYGKEVRPRIGVEILPDNIRLRAQGEIVGVPILTAALGEPAAQAGIIGLQVAQNGTPVYGDIIVAIDDLKITDQDDLYNALEQYQAGDKVSVITMRNQQLLEIDVTLAESLN